MRSAEAVSNPPGTEVSSPGASVRPGSFRAWALACRPATLTAALAPVLVGTAVAYVSRGMQVRPALAALAGAMLIQIATNFANDVFDHEKGADTHERLGPTRAVQAGLLTARQVRIGLLVTIALTVPIGLYLATAGGWPIVAIGVASILSGVAYTGGPYPLGYHGLGDVFVFVFFGLVAVCGTVFVQAGSVPPLAWAASIPVGALATAVLVVNNVRDRDTDVVAGKRTLAVRFGRRAGVAEYAMLLAAAYAVPIALAVGYGRSWALLTLATFPRAMRLLHALATTDGRPLNACLAGTAKLLLAFSILFSLGLAAVTR
jgi:1,4-dihydroxy-2-naphthoate polyprenyltransferase